MTQYIAVVTGAGVIFESGGCCDGHGGGSRSYVFHYALMSAGQYNAQIVAVSELEKLSTFATSLVELHISQSQPKQIACSRQQSGCMRTPLLNSVQPLIS